MEIAEPIGNQKAVQVKFYRIFIERTSFITMTAVAEARALLDQLMGGERNAPLPKGAALPRKRKDGGSDGMLLLPGKRSKSCYDRDICPLYCAWGVDVYELFVNTKSDIGPNPYKPDDSARQEFINLSKHEQERLGFEHLLFNKLGELVSSCDRTVQRNQEKLNKELQRQLQKRGGHDYVMDVDEEAVEQLCRNQIKLKEKMEELGKALENLTSIRKKEDAIMTKTAEEDEKTKESVKQEEAKQGDIIKVEEGTKEENGVKEETEGSKTDAPVKTEEQPISSENEAKPDGGDETSKNKEEDEAAAPAAPKPPSKQALELGAILLEKQAAVVDVANLISQVSPLQETVETQERNLNHVKSDITTDKTVCEVSGNFMSARDADERIAAHYAGKQYVGWKLVRDKFTQLLKQYGKYGPPPPGRSPPPPGVGGSGPPPHLPSAPPRGGEGRGGGWRGGPDDRGRSGPPGGGRRNPGGRWERGGGYERGYDRGGYDRGGRRGGGGYGRGGGGWGRR